MLVAFLGVMVGFGLVASWLDNEANRVSDAGEIGSSQRRSPARHRPERSSGPRPSSLSLLPFGTESRDAPCMPRVRTLPEPMVARLIDRFPRVAPPAWAGPA
jgi:hypothetical protein